MHLRIQGPKTYYSTSWLQWSLSPQWHTYHMFNPWSQLPTMYWNILTTMISLLSARCFGLFPSSQLLLWWRWADQSYQRDFCFLSYFNPMVVGRSILSSWLLFLFHIIPEPTDRAALVFSGCFKAGTQKQPGQRTFEQWNNHVLSSPSPQSSYWVLNLVWFSISGQWLSDPQCPDGESRGDGGCACRPEEKCRGESKNYGKVSRFSDI